MNLYKKLLDQQKEKKEIEQLKQSDKNEIERLKQNKRSLEYYYKNKDSILKKHYQKKLSNAIYYKEWYNKNKLEIQEKRRTLKKVNKLSNKYSNCSVTPNNDQKEKKKISFTLFF